MLKNAGMGFGKANFIRDDKRFGKTGQLQVCVFIPLHVRNAICYKSNLEIGRFEFF